MVCLRGGVIFTGNGQNLAESGKFDISFDIDLVLGGAYIIAPFLMFAFFYSFAASNRFTTLAATFRRHEAEKRRAYEERIREVEHGLEHGSFTPLVFSSSGGMGKAATTTYKSISIWLNYTQ